MSQQPFVPKPGPAPVPRPAAQSHPNDATETRSDATVTRSDPSSPVPAPAGVETRQDGTPAPGNGSSRPSGASPASEQTGGQGFPTHREPTGDAAVDRALDDLDALPGQPLDRHIEVGQQVHRTLQGRLADIGRE
jgi:hypothetical protein